MEAIFKWWHCVWCSGLTFVIILSGWVHWRQHWASSITLLFTVHHTVNWCNRKEETSESTHTQKPNQIKPNIWWFSITRWMYYHAMHVMYALAKVGWPSCLFCTLAPFGFIFCYTLHCIHITLGLVAVVVVNS